MNCLSFNILIDVLQRCITTPTDKYRDRFNINTFFEFIDTLLESSANWNKITLTTIEGLKIDYYKNSYVEVSIAIENIIREDKKQFNDSMDRNVGILLKKYTNLLKLFYYHIDTVEEFKTIQDQYLNEAKEYIDKIVNKDVKIENPSKQTIKGNLLNFYRKAKSSFHDKEYRDWFTQDFNAIDKDFCNLHKFIEHNIEKYSQEYRFVSFNVKLQIFHSFLNFRI